MEARSSAQLVVVLEGRPPIERENETDSWHDNVNGSGYAGFFVNEPSELFLNPDVSLDRAGIDTKFVRFVGTGSMVEVGTGSDPTIRG